VSQRKIPRKMSDYKIKEYLLNNDKEFKKLYDLHQKCEKELANLNQNSNISSEEVLNTKIIKRRKLSLKDSMQRMINAQDVSKSR